MAILDMTPPMTSNTAPSPYVVTASDSYSSMPPWKAFNKMAGADGWRSSTAPNAKDHFIMIDTGTQTKVTRLEIYPRIGNSEVTKSNVQDFEFWGSMDGNDWKLISPFTTNAADEMTMYSFPVQTFRFFKLNILSNYGSSFISISEIKLLFDTDYEGIYKSSYAQILPMNTTNSILSKFGDYRVGLLGMASDDENFGDLYVVGKDGRAHLTKAGTKSELIFKGKANTVGDYILGKNIKKYKYLLVCSSNDNNTTGADTLKMSTLIPVDHVDFGTTIKYIRAYRMVIVESGNIDFGFKDETTLTVDRITPTSYNSSVQITKIIGIY